MNQEDLDQIIATKKAAQSRLLALPGVHAVGIGGKYVGGHRTTEPAIIVFVAKKKPLSDLAPEEVVPPEIDGVKTDVVEEEPPQIFMGEDDSSYRPLEGGIQLQPGGGLGLIGTLGLIAHTDEPVPRTVALTCHHVAAFPPGGLPTGLNTTVSADKKSLSFSGANTAGSLVVADLVVMPGGPGPAQDIDIYWTTTATDTLASIASAVAAEINGLANPGVSAAAAGPQVTITSGAGFIAIFQSGTVYNPPKIDDSSDLRATVQGNVITLSGGVSEGYGVYTNLNIAGVQPSHGVFTVVAAGDDLNSVATSIAAAINALHVTGVNAAAAGAQITVSGAQEVECWITSDVRVGQPVNTFCSKCLGCCDDRIGRVVDARLDVDVALVQLDGGMKYKAEIEEIGVIAGTHAVTLAEALSGYPVQKRGRTTGLTTGTVTEVEVDGDIGQTDAQSPPAWRLFHRHYTNALRITASGAFAGPGDSGAAVVNNTNEVVGIVFGGGASTARATPIEQITAAVSVTVPTAASPGIVQTVPEPAHAITLESRPGIADTGSAGRRIGTASTTNRLQEVAREIEATPVGREYGMIVRRHASEARALLNGNRRVAVLWHRNGGSALGQALSRWVQVPRQPLPAEVDGKPWGQCVENIAAVFRKYASSEFIADLERILPHLTGLASKTYPEFLNSLQTGSVE